jgi:hypothetical protein
MVGPVEAAVGVEGVVARLLQVVLVVPVDEVK